MCAGRALEAARYGETIVASDNGNHSRKPQQRAKKRLTQRHRASFDDSGNLPGHDNWWRIETERENERREDREATSLAGSRSRCRSGERCVRGQAAPQEWNHPVVMTR